jgi:hypothetical protein
MWSSSSIIANRWRWRAIAADGAPVTLEAMVRRLHTDDLFELFPDLPWTGRPRTDAQLARLHRQVDETHARAGENSRRQKAANERVRANLAARRRR